MICIQVVLSVLNIFFSKIQEYSYSKILLKSIFFRFQARSELETRLRSKVFSLSKLNKLDATLEIEFLAACNEQLKK